MNSDEILNQLDAAEQAAFEAAKKAVDHPEGIAVLTGALVLRGLTSAEAAARAQDIVSRHFPPLPIAREDGAALLGFAHALPYPLGSRLAALLRAVERFDAGEGAPSFAPELLALSSFLQRFTCIVLLRSYLDAGATDPRLNRNLVQVFSQGLGEATFLAISRAICETKKHPEAEVALAGGDVAPGLRVPQLRDEGLKDLDYLAALHEHVSRGEPVAPAYLRFAFDVLARALRRFSFLTRFELVLRTGAGGLRFQGETPQPVATLDAMLPEGEPVLVARDKSVAPLSLAPLLRARVTAAGVTFEESFFVRAEAAGPA